ncbi:MAG: HpaII family restriction endonuclease, partial [Bacillales bacterium]|nr:HpaII family restriction endonuclease [Bacillales bacterium]
MLSFNRGEWSELYGILFLLIKPKLKIVNENLHPIKTDLFLVKEIILDSKLKLSYKIIKDNIAIFVAEKEYKKLSVLEVDITRKELLNKVLSAKSGSFE